MLQLIEGSGEAAEHREQLKPFTLVRARSVWKCGVSLSGQLGSGYAHHNPSSGLGSDTEPRLSNPMQGGRIPRPIPKQNVDDLST